MNDAERKMADALRPFGWTCTDEFWRRYYSDPWVFNLANAVERLTERLPAEPAPVTCPECGGRGRRGCGAAWHDGKPDDAPSPADEAIARRGGAGTVPATPEGDQQ